MNEKDLLEIIKREILKYTKDLEINNRKSIAFLGNDIILKKDLENSFDISETSQKVIVSELDIKDLVALSQGSYCSEMGEQILTEILSGKDIIISKDGMKWRNFKNIPSTMQALYEGYEEKLGTFGIQILDRMEIKNYIEKKENYYMGKILDVKTIKNSFIDKDLILVSQNTIVTELAYEYARERNIKIVKG